MSPVRESAPGPSGLPRCGQGRAADTRLRIGSCLLLVGLAVRLGIQLNHAGHALAAVLFALAVLALGGCLWWVAQRQCGQAGAALAVLFYVSSPPALRPGPESIAALGLFAMLYTAVGVAHALQGPRRKWGPRIALMAALTAFTAAMQTVAACTGLVLGLPAMLYLAEGRRRLLLPFFFLWSVAAALAALPAVDFTPNPPTAMLSPPGGLALAGALALWAAARRSRYFGNSAPLLASVLLLALSWRVGDEARVWALPFALLFLAGTASDAWEGRRGRFWTAFFWGLAAVQFLVAFW